MSDDELLAQVADLSRRAYSLARAKADGGAAGDALRPEAETIDSQLDDILSAVQAVEDEAIRAAWTDARADVMWVLSDGNMPTSLRLAAYLRDRRS